MKEAPLIQLRKGTEDAPIFLFSGASANPKELAGLAAHMRNPKAMIGVDFCALDDERGVPMTVATMAERSFSAIRVHQPRGPYHLVGYSFGGLVAIETARLLREAGEEIALLGLIDTFLDYRHWPAGISLRFKARQTRRRLTKLLYSPPSHAIPMFFLRARRLLARFLARRNLLSSTIWTPKSPLRPAKLEHCLTVARNYSPKYYAGRVTVFGAENHDHGCDLAELWRKFASEVERRLVPGTHLGVVRDDAQIDKLAATLDRFLDDLNLDSSQGHLGNHRPQVLLITAYRWPTTTRLAFALSDAGFAVEAVCPTGHSLKRVKFVSTTYRYSPLNPLRSLRAAIAAAKPDLIVPSDDIAAARLHELYRLTAKDSRSGKLRALIARSLGDPENYPNFYSRARIASVAQAAGVRCPAVTNIRDLSDLNCKIETIGFPAVLKTDGSSGGMGVALVRNRSEIESSFGKLAAYHSATRALKRLAVNSDANVVLPCLRRKRVQVSVQPFIDGRSANAAVACWNGTVLAQVCVEVLATNNATGPATVVRVIAHQGMSQATERMVRALKLSGLCGFDFILDSADGSAHLIDFNPRATQTCHLTASDGRQLLASLATKLRGSPAIDSHRDPQDGPIVLFPHGFVFGSNSPYSEHIHSDVPPNSPEFVNFGLEFRQQQNRFIAKAIRQMRHK